MNNRCKNDGILLENDDTETILLLSEAACSSLWSSLSPFFSLISFVSVTNHCHWLRFVPENLFLTQGIRFPK